MIIRRIEKSPEIQYAYLNIFPDQFKTEKEKQDKSYIKNTIDYFANVAYAQYVKHRETFVPNYDLLKGIIDYKHFYKENDETQSIIDNLVGNKLPPHIKHYPIINPPLNTMIGELTKRPDAHRVRAFDDFSRSEEMEFKTDVVNRFILQQAKEKILMNLAEKGVEVDSISSEDLENLTIERVQDYLTDYTSLAEMWGNHTLEALKAEFNMKEKSEDAFRDLLTSSREFYHIYEDNSKRGFNIEVANPKNVWYLTLPDQKYLKDNAYAVGTVEVMEISQIIDKFPDLTKKEIDHLRTSLQDYGLVNVRESNLFLNETGIESIKYDTYNRLVLQERMMVEAELKENNDELRDWLGLTNNTSAFGYKYTVVRAYWKSKKLVGKLTYLDEDGNEQTVLVDETYKEGSPNEISIEWGWVNQWYQGARIGPDIYLMKPFKLLDYPPIIGVIHEIKNTHPRSLVDLMKPYQVLYNICMNQLYELLGKEIGVVYQMSIRHVPRPKDGDNQDALDMWEEEARKRGIVFVDDSPENTKAPSNFNQFSRQDLTRTQEIESRYRLAAQLKTECWELVGMNRERLGGVAATQTATGTQTALSQSFAQTEPYFAQHEYVLDDVYQALLDAAQWVESHKEQTTLNYITNQGESAFIQVNGSDIKLRDLHVLSTSRPQDQEMFNELRQLAQAMIQNGASIYDISVLYTTNSTRQMQKVFKSLKEKQEKMLEQQQQMEQQKLQQEQEQFQAQMQEAARQKEIDRANDNYNKEQDRITKERVAIITATGFGKVESEDTNSNQVPDVLEASRLDAENLKSQRDHDVKLQQLQQKQRELETKRDLELKKLEVDREKIEAQKYIARTNKNKYDKKPKK